MHLDSLKLGAGGESLEPSRASRWAGVSRDSEALVAEDVTDAELAGVEAEGLPSAEEVRAT